MDRKPSATVSELQAHLGFWLRFVSNHVSQAFAQKLLTTGITVAEWVMLRSMFGRGAAAPSELAEATGLTRGAVSKLLDRLVQKELVSRESALHDRRYQRVKLTAAGRAVVPRLAALADRNDAEFFGPLTKKEQAALRKLLTKLVAENGLTEVPTA